MTNPAVLMTGAYPAWDLEDLEARYRVLKLWEAPDRDAFLAEHARRGARHRHPRRPRRLRRR